MTPTSLNGLVLYVTDVATTLALYKQLGFSVLTQRLPDYASVTLGDFLIQFQSKDTPLEAGFRAEAMIEPKGGGLFIYIQVEGIDRYYTEVQERGIVPTTAPRDWPSGNREFVVRDPDGYKLVFYEPHAAHSYQHEHSGKK